MEVPVEAESIFCKVTIAATMEKNFLTDILLSNQNPKDL